MLTLCFNDLSVVANTIAALDSCAFVIHAFVPLIKKPPSTLAAVVDAAPASEPFPKILWKSKIL